MLRGHHRPAWEQVFYVPHLIKRHCFKYLLTIIPPSFQLQPISHYLILVLQDHHQPRQFDSNAGCIPLILPSVPLQYSLFQNQILYLQLYHTLAIFPIYDFNKLCQYFYTILQKLRDNTHKEFCIGLFVLVLGFFFCNRFHMHTLFKSHYPLNIVQAGLTHLHNAQKNL